jgi:ligand-binding sensor domain-containing protein
MKGIYAFILAVFSGLTAFGQTPYFQQYFLLGKNESVAVNTIFQDRSGIMWFGTSKGLFSFDGVNQKRFAAGDLPDEHVTAISQDSKGRIWTGHKNGRLAVMQNDTFAPFIPIGGPAKAEISSLLFDEDGTLWFSTLGDGMYYVINNKSHHLDERSLPDNFVYNLVPDAKGNIWAGTDGGVAVCTLNGGKVSVRTVSSSNGLPDNIIRKPVGRTVGS